MVHSEYQSALNSILLLCGRALIGIAGGFIITGIILLAVVYANFSSYSNPGTVIFLTKLINNCCFADAFVISGGVLLGFGGLLLIVGIGLLIFRRC